MEAFVGSGKCFGFFEGDVMLVESFDGLNEFFEFDVALAVNVDLLLF